VDQTDSAVDAPGRHRDRRSRARRSCVKSAGRAVKEPYGAHRRGRPRHYQGLMTDVLYLLITLAAFAGLALLAGALDR